MRDAFREAEKIAFEEWLQSECPSGDVSLVQHKWETSMERRWFVEEYNDKEGAI